MKSTLRICFCLLIIAATIAAGCDRKGIAGPRESQPSLVPAPAVSYSDTTLPVSGVRAIFRSDFPFVTRRGQVSELSVPPTRPGCGVKLLCEGDERLKWRMDLLGRASKNVRIQTFIFTADEAGEKVADALRELRGKGRDVRLTVDAYTKFRPEDRLMYNKLELAGIQVMGLEPVYFLGLSDHYTFDYKEVNRRFHEKYLVVDNEVAIVGGTNIANEYYRYGDESGDQWRDQDVALTGPVVADVARAFEDNYEFFRLKREGRLPTNRALWFGRAWWEVSGTGPPPIERADNSKGLGLAVENFDDPNAGVRYLRHRPRHKEDYLFQAYLYLFDNATESILVENAYFVPNRALLNSLMRASKRGVKVTIITNSEATNDVPGMAPLARYAYMGLVENGARVYEWQGLRPGKGCLHSKFAVIDGQVTVIGSCNLDPRSLGINSEDVVIIDSQTVAEKLAEYVEKVDLAHSVLISLEQAVEWHEPDDMAEKYRIVFGQALEDWY